MAPAEVVELVAQATGVPVDAMQAIESERVAARRVAVMLLRENGFLWKEIGAQFNEPADWAHTAAKRGRASVEAGHRTTLNFLRKALAAVREGAA